jgi:hypothetical protein
MTLRTEDLSFRAWLDESQPNWRGAKVPPPLVRSAQTPSSPTVLAISPTRLPRNG